MNGNDCKVSSGFTTYRKYKKSPFYSLFFRSTYFRAALTIVRLWHRSPFFRPTFFRKLFYLFDILLFWHFPCRHLVVCFIFPKLFSSTILIPDCFADYKECVSAFLGVVMILLDLKNNQLYLQHIGDQLKIYFWCWFC